VKTPAHSPWRILLVDDNEDLVDSLRSVLLSDSRRPLSIRAAASQAEALADAREHGFDVAIVDVKLPDGSGVELASTLREIQPLGEVVLVTGFATVDSAIAALKSGAYAFILKSFRPEELVATVDQALTKVELVRDREDLEGRYRDLIEHTDVLVIGFDVDHRVVLFNHRASQLTGLERHEALGNNILTSWIPEADWPKFRAAEARLGTTGAAEAETEFSALGLQRTIRWHLSPGRGLVYAMGIDVTERIGLEKRLREGEALSAMGVLAMHLAHEIRNPLNAAVLQLHLMTRQMDKLEVDDAQKTKFGERVSVVESELGRLNRMLTEFLELARPREGARESLHLGNLVDEVLNLEREAALARGIGVIRDFRAITPLVRGDREKLKQVVLNLVINAFEAMKEGGNLRVELAVHERDLVLDLLDDGQGIDPQLAERVFEPFFTTKEGGTGLGLSIVRKIVDQHGGSLRIGPRPEGGTRVTLKLPLLDPK